MVRIPVILVAFAAALPAATAVAQSSDCDSYSVVARFLNLRSAPDISSNIVDVLRNNQIVCIGQIQTTAGQQWGNVTSRAEPDGSAPETVDGWSNMGFLSAVTMPSAPASNDTAAVAPDTSVATDVATDTADAGDAAKDAGPAPHIDPGSVAFEDIIEVGPFPVRGRSLAQLVSGIPLFPPIAGLPEDRWKSQCVSCHRWDRDRLCAQGKSYADDPASVFRIQHPYGGPFKKALGAWAAGGCP
jgi:hypothetical protein